MAWKFVSFVAMMSSWTARCELHSEVSRSNRRRAEVSRRPLRPSSPNEDGPDARVRVTHEVTQAAPRPGHEDEQPREVG